MNFLLKIVEGPNKGAEIALVEGVAVTIGKTDDCDIILADPTLPDAPFPVEATASGVTFDGSALEPFHVRSVGSTAFAIGPADGAWGELVWPQPEKTPAAEEPDAADAGERDEAAASGDARPSTEPTPADAPRRRHGCLGCLLWLIVLLLILLGLAWFFRDALRPKAEELWRRLTEGRPAQEATGVSLPRDAESLRESGALAASSDNALPALAEKYGLSLTNDTGRAVLSGNFRTRAERLAATAEVYESQPGVELDLSDDESFGTAATDALFTLTEGALKVVAATNRVLAIAGVVPSAGALKRTLEALNADMPKLRNVDATGVRLDAAMEDRHLGDGADGSRRDGGFSSQSSRKAANPQKAQVAFPVCGILTTPYPCLVMKNGQRILEGAAIGDSVVLKITADSVTITNASGRFTWKP